MLKMRIAIEQFIATTLIQHIIAHPGLPDHPGNFTISVNDGEETVLRNSRTTADILKAMFSTDEDVIIVHNGDGKMIGSVWLIYGNSGWDVISDYSISLEDVISPVMEIADMLDRGGYRISIVKDPEAWNKERV